MSQIAPTMHREPVLATPRKRLTKAQKAELLNRQQDCCGNCGVSLVWQVVEGQKIYGPAIHGVFHKFADQWLARWGTW